jgi:sugar lactone lactonase YvrE
MGRFVRSRWIRRPQGAARSIGIARLRLLIGALHCLLLCLLLSSCAGLGGPGPPEEEPYVLIPPPPQEPRIQFLGSYTSDQDVVPPQSGFRRFIVGDPGRLELAKPYGIAIHDGQILVCDTKAGLVVEFDLKARTFELLGAGPEGKLGKPINVAVDEEGNRYVADLGLKRLMIYDRNNSFLRALGTPETWAPSDVAIVGKRIYVTDKQNGQVVVLEKQTGQEVRRFSKLGAGEGELFFPTNIAVGFDGSVYVTDTGNFRVLKFNSRGKLLQQFGSLGRAHGQFVRPKGVAVDREGRVYVVDAASEFVQIFDPDGELLLFFGGAGNHPGGLNLPAKVAIDYENVDLFTDLVAPGHEIEYLILVTNQFGLHKVNVFGYLKQGQRKGG